MPDEDEASELVDAQHLGQVQVEGLLVQEQRQQVAAVVLVGQGRDIEELVHDSDRENLLLRVGEEGQRHQQNGQPVFALLVLDPELNDLDHLQRLGVVEHKHLLLECLGVDCDGVLVPIEQLLLVGFDYLCADSSAESMTVEQVRGQAMEGPG